MRFIILSFFLFLSATIFSQSLKIGSLVSDFNNNGTVNGFVYDGENDKDPLIFAEVFVKETNTTITTDVDGSFKLKLKSGKYSLKFSFLGYKSIEVNNVEILSNSSLKLNQVLKALKPEATVSEVSFISKVK